MGGDTEMPLQLTDAGRTLLQSVLKTRAPDMLSVARPDWSGPVTGELIEQLINKVSDELVETGLDRSDEHTPRGVMLEDLIDELNRLRWAT